MSIFRDITFGALAGITATMVMTTTMRRLHSHLPPEEQYPLPPREITVTMLPAASRKDGAATTMLAHFGYGAATGALYACFANGRVPGVIYGPAVWAASYLALFPGADVLTAAGRHPARRNALMILAHVVWGETLRFGLKELHKAANGGFGCGLLRDARSPAENARTNNG